MENDEIQQDGADTTVETAEETVAADTEVEGQETDWKAEALKYKAILKRTAEKAKEPAKPVAKQVNADDIDSVLSLQAEGYSPNEIKSLREYGRKMGKPINEVIADEVIKAGFESLRMKAKTESAIPSPSKRSMTFKGKSLNDTILTGSPADAQAAIEQRMASMMGNKNNE